MDQNKWRNKMTTSLFFVRKNEKGICLDPCTFSKKKSKLHIPNRGDIANNLIGHQVVITEVIRDTKPESSKFGVKFVKTNHDPNNCSLCQREREIEQQNQEHALKKAEFLKNKNQHLEFFQILSNKFDQLKEEMDQLEISRNKFLGKYQYPFRYWFKKPISEGNDRFVIKYNNNDYEFDIENETVKKLIIVGYDKVRAGQGLSDDEMRTVYYYDNRPIYNRESVSDDMLDEILENNKDIIDQKENLYWEELQVKQIEKQFEKNKNKFEKLFFEKNKNYNNLKDEIIDIRMQLGKLHYEFRLYCPDLKLREF